VNERLDRADVDDPAPGRAQLCEKGMGHVEHAVEVDRHDVLPVLDHRFGGRGEGVAAVDAGIVDQDGDPADGRADLRGNLAAFVALGHVEHEATGLAAGARDGLGGLSRAVAVGVEHDHVRSLPRIAQRDRPADAGGAAGDSRNVLLEKARHFPPLQYRGGGLRRHRAMQSIV